MEAWFLGRKKLSCTFLVAAMKIELRWYSVSPFYSILTKGASQVDDHINVFV